MFSAIFKRFNVNFVSYYFFEQSAFKAHLRICVDANVCVFERAHESRLCVLCSLQGLPGHRC